MYCSCSRSGHQQQLSLITSHCDDCKTGSARNTHSRAYRFQFASWVHNDCRYPWSCFCALQTLRDPQSRLLYDHELSQAELRATVVLHDDIDLEDMDQSIIRAGSDTASTQGSCQYSYPCRCGDSYMLTTEDMQLAAHTQQIVIPCRWVRKDMLLQQL